ncbi:hypothetical protein K504DRAFT_467970 [Pleomassaria siparia CBS 279.74]|uniref:Zn(2)-C6 fungal-type domain-containing protein n=1 Tax=Pleomassaria siparia CBS 279.74 TaxID=1314801 RepID=A0A6G1K771_9PLEO|nr:hypothetical protein K504DRAFT_467970 [Pleomassaria siparia CBS 279.74]
MVSRGGRSKGCSNCRRRRVKCDETRPICVRCKKRKLECDGPKEVTWVSQTVFPPTPPEDDCLLLPSRLPVDMPLAAFEDDICLAFTRKRLLRGGSVEVAYDMVTSDIHDSKKPGIVLLRAAVMSLAVTFFGSQHCQTKIKNRGYRQYGDVLSQLNVRLSQPEFQTSNETILTALTCMLLEMFLPTGPRNFLKHLRGIESMLELRGPPASPDIETAKILHGLRLLCTMGALAMSQPALFAREEWKSLPCIHRNEAGLLRHRIFLILADATRLKHDRDTVIAAGLVQNYPLLISESQLRLDTLQEVHADWVIFNEKRMGDCTSPLGKELNVADYVSATVQMLYNTALIVLLEIIESLDPSPKYASVRNAAAAKMTKCLELKTYEQREGAPQSNTIGFVATKVAWHALGAFQSPEGRKLAKVVKKAVNGVFAVDAWTDNQAIPPIRNRDKWYKETNAETAPRITIDSGYKATQFRHVDFGVTSRGLN